MSFFQRANARIRRFFTGCYGGDQLSKAMTYASLILILLGAIPHMEALLLIAYVLVILSFARMFSRKIEARRRENTWFLQKTAPLIEKAGRIRFSVQRKIAPPVTKFNQARARFRNRKAYAYFRCPGCRSWLKLPRGAGNVTVTCGHCGQQTNRKA